MKSLTLLWKMVALECATRCCTSATMDIKTVHSRFEHEGLSFLAITLPNFGKDFEKSLDQERVDRSSFTSFSWRAGLPRFLGGFLDRVFDRSDGVLLDEPCIDAIRSIRQLTLMFGKINVPCTPARERAAFAQYIQCEQDVRVADAKLSIRETDDFRRISSLLFSSMFSVVDREIYNGNILPKHGPGSTAEGLLGNRKLQQLTWPARLEAMFPCGDFLLPNHRFYDELETVDILEPGTEIPVSVISVPKTLKTPRIIAKEPIAMQYVQQGILELIRSGLSREKTIKSMIGIDDQVPNQHMASVGSESRGLATLDLSEASDRVSNQHVRLLLERFPWFSRAVDSTRSRKADVPGHGVVRLAKYASMGSALTFPLEAMVFLTIVFIGIERELNTQLSHRDVRSLVGSVRVYGDDIIIPVDYVRSVVRSLQAFGLVVNEGKSFWNGKFRESCGKEYYDGEDVTVVRVRQMLPTQRKDATGVISTVSLRNQLYWAGYWKTAAYLDGLLQRILKHYPMVLPSSPVLGRESALGYETQKIHEHLQIPLVRGFVVSAQPPVSKLDGWPALLKYFLKRGHEPSFSEDHLERSGRPHAVYTKLRWSPPF